jgi:hypothetical protein
MDIKAAIHAYNQAKQGYEAGWEERCLMAAAPHLREDANTRIAELEATITRMEANAAQATQNALELHEGDMLRVAELVAQVREGEWKLITPESLPNGFPHDECLHRAGYVGTPGTLDYDEKLTYERVTYLGWTHYRPISPPAPSRAPEGVSR